MFNTKILLLCNNWLKSRFKLELGQNPSPWHGAESGLPGEFNSVKMVLVGLYSVFAISWKEQRRNHSLIMVYIHAVACSSYKHIFKTFFYMSFTPFFPYFMLQMKSLTWESDLSSDRKLVMTVLDSCNVKILSTLIVYIHVAGWCQKGSKWVTSSCLSVQPFQHLFHGQFSSDSRAWILPMLIYVIMVIILDILHLFVFYWDYLNM